VGFDLCARQRAAPVIISERVRKIYRHEKTAEDWVAVTNTESANGEAVIEGGVRPGLTLAVVAVVQFMVSLDLSVVNVGLPEIGSGLGFSELSLTWVIHAYALTFGGLLLLGGKIADRTATSGS
jgi:hypothetical protein